MRMLQLRPGLRIYSSDSRELILDQEIGSGGEGSVWSISGSPALAAKFYHRELASDHVQKIDAMCRMKTEKLQQIAAWPTALLSAKPGGRPEGLLMPRVNGYRAAHLLYNPKSRRTFFPEAQFPFILHCATNVARAFATIHDAGQVIGDVNHGNLLVAASGVVALIDCDSFQIADRGNFYHCPVGVPEYTPPELQEKDFQYVLRTPHHDAFGMAVLIFHILFLGRHPFAGIYKNGTADITIEQAISEYRFAYSLNTNVTQMQPPPSALRLTELTPTISSLFLRSFASNGLRPPAHEWVAALESAARGLKQCAANPSHHYFNHAPSCPWCRVEAMVGIPMFGVTLVIAHDDQFDIRSVWAKIDAIQPALKSGVARSHQPALNAFPAAAGIRDLIWSRSKRRIVSITVMAFAIAIVGGVQPEPLVSIAILAGVLFLAAKIWQQGNLATNSFKAEFENARRDYNAALAEGNMARNVPDAFSAERQLLVKAKQTIENLPSMRVQRLAELNAAGRKKQLQRFLESHRIEDASLPNIGKGRKQLLAVYNVVDASDVEVSRITGIKGFGPTMQTILLAWRASIEKQFRFDPNEGIAPEDLRQLEQELQQKRVAAIRSLTTGPQQLMRVLRKWDHQVLNSETKLADASRRAAQAKVNVDALGPWHWRIEYAALVLVVTFLGFLLWLWPRSFPIPPHIPRDFGKVGPRRIYRDQTRTPGAINPTVSQANIGSTICNSGWSTRNIRPPDSYTRKLKLQQMRDWALPGDPVDYEEDHFISLDLGGHPTDPRNLWPQPYDPKPGAREKDLVERYLHAQVCSGKMTLTGAQRAIAADWYEIYFLVTGDQIIGAVRGDEATRR